MSYNNGPRIVTDGLVFCIDPVSLKNSTSTLVDLGPQNCNGTLTNGASFVNNYIFLDGTNDFINFASNNIINNAITIDIWVYTNSTSNSFLIAAGDNSYNSDAWDWSIFPYDGNMLCRGTPGGGGTNIGSLSTIYLNNWINIVLDRTGLVYRNGSYLSATFIGSGSTKPLRLGGISTNYFNGRIGPVKIYNKTLTSNEISQNYLATKSRYNL